MVGTIHVDPEQVYQRSDGFGFCQPFWHAHLLDDADDRQGGRCRRVLLPLLVRAASGPTAVHHRLTDKDHSLSSIAAKPASSAGTLLARSLAAIVFDIRNAGRRSDPSR